MKTALRLHCRDLRASTQFYDHIFWVHRIHRTKPDAQVQHVSISNGLSLKLVERGDRAATHWDLEITGFDVFTLYERIRGHIPEHDGLRETLPNGHCWGPHEFPGGCLLVIRDPDGHELDFAEW